MSSGWWVSPSTDWVFPSIGVDSSSPQGSLARASLANSSSVLSEWTGWAEVWAWASIKTCDKSSLRLHKCCRAPSDTLRSHDTPVSHLPWPDGASPWWLWSLLPCPEGLATAPLSTSPAHPGLALTRQASFPRPSSRLSTPPALPPSTVPLPWHDPMPSRGSGNSLSTLSSLPLPGNKRGVSYQES